MRQASDTAPCLLQTVSPVRTRSRTCQAQIRCGSQFWFEGRRPETRWPVRPCTIRVRSPRSRRGSFLWTLSSGSATAARGSSLVRIRRFHRHAAPDLFCSLATADKPSVRDDFGFGQYVDSDSRHLQRRHLEGGHRDWAGSRTVQRQENGIRCASWGGFLPQASLTPPM